MSGMKTKTDNIEVKQKTNVWKSIKSFWKAPLTAEKMGSVMVGTGMGTTLVGIAATILIAEKYYYPYLRLAVDVADEVDKFGIWCGLRSPPIFASEIHKFGTLKDISAAVTIIGITAFFIGAAVLSHASEKRSNKAIKPLEVM